MGGGKLCIQVHAPKDIPLNAEAFIVYGYHFFCRASLPLGLLFKAVTHYWNQIMSSPDDCEHWSQIPQARTLFNSPYHTCKPRERNLILEKITLHYNTCSDSTCTCALQQHLDNLALASPTDNKRKKVTPSRKPRRTGPETSCTPYNASFQYFALYCSIWEPGTGCPGSNSPMSLL